MVDSPPKPAARWFAWAMLLTFLFLAFECVLFAVALKGRWFILLAPGAVCSIKALDLWREMRRDRSKPPE